ncbi:MAG: RNA polymerase sigma factor [Myxococcota bacterium]
MGSETAPFPFARPDPIDPRLATAAVEGDRAALEELLRRHQRWVFNLARRMLHREDDAADATQEILVKVATRIAQFEGRSAFRTWLYRIATNHLLRRRGRRELEDLTFDRFRQELDDFPDAALPETDIPDDLLLKESLTSCTTGMLLCLSREQRMVYILGSIFGVTDVVAAEILEISPVAYRKRLSRARAHLQAFMQGQCGLVDARNPCRCRKKTKAFVDAGHIRPDRLTFSSDRLQTVSDMLPGAVQAIFDLDRAYAGLFRSHGFYHPPRDLAAEVSALLETPSAETLIREDPD